MPCCLSLASCTSVCLKIGITIDKLINLLVIITLFEMMVAIGLGVTFRALLDVARNWRLVTRAALANYIVVPATALGLLLLFDAHPMVAAGLSLPQFALVRIWPAFYGNRPRRCSHDGRSDGDPCGIVGPHFTVVAACVGALFFRK